MKEEILKYLQEHGESKTGDLVVFLGKERTTIYRWLKKLEALGKVEQVKKGRYKIKESLEDYFDAPTWERITSAYNPEFLNSYKPNETYFFSKENLKRLESSVKDLPIDTDFYKTNKKFLEKSLIVLSFASSYLEGNTYSYLDTEVLLKYNEINKEKTSEETQMISNHKKAIEYMIYYKRELLFSRQSFFEIHTLLGEKLLLQSDLGRVRDKIVEIGGSTYSPLGNRYKLEEEFEKFLHKLNLINNPFEQSLFIMTFIPYFQLFLDINKRTSRIIGSLPLIKYNLPVLSMIQIEKKQYIMAILAVYELNDVSLLQDIWAENYILNLSKYKQYFN